MADIVDYELKIGEQFFLLDEKAFSIHKCTCNLIMIKTYKDDQDVVVTTIEYLLELNDGNTVLADESAVYENFTEASLALEELISA